MDDLKHKILTLINKQGPKIPSMGFSDANYHFPQCNTLSINSKTVTESDRPADQDILESIEAAYFSMDSNFDICNFELKKLPEVLDCDHIQRDFKLLKRQHQVVSKKVLQLILEHQNSCNEEFKRIHLIHDELKEALMLCRESRKDLMVAEKQLSSSLSILANYRKRKIVQNLLKSLNTIKTLYCTDNRLRELLREENYAGAIELLQECRSAANTYRHFTCVAALSNKLQETLEYTEEQLDHVLAQMCYYFDINRYDKLQLAYKLLGKTQIAVDHLHMHYISAIYNTSMNIVHVYASNDASSDVQDNNNTVKKPYKKLCSSVNSNVFIPCLIDLCKSLFKIILSYYKLVKWHNMQELQEEQELEEQERLEDDTDKRRSDNDIEDNFNKQYIRHKLDHNLQKIWQDVQSKVSSLLLNNDLSSYKFDQFVQVLSVVHRLIEVGEEFCASKSEELQETLRKQSVNYFFNYHAERMDELKIFLENETWELCPVKRTFDIVQLHEFKSIKSILKNYKNQSHVVKTETSCSSSNSQDDDRGSSTVIVGNYFVRYGEHGTPFDVKLDESSSMVMDEEDILMNYCDVASGYFTDSDEDVDDDEEEDAEEPKRDFVDEYVQENRERLNLIEKLDKNRNQNNKVAPILTNTALSVLRQMGKYCQMSRLLRPVAYEIINSMTELFDFYLYTVHDFFANDLSVSSSSLYSTNLKSTLKRIQDTLVITNENGEENEEKSKRSKVMRPKLSPIVDLNAPEKLNGLYERIVAVESLIFLSRQFEYLQGFFEYLITSQSKIALRQFFNQTISSATDLRRPIYMSVVARVFDLRQILISMSKINWEVKDVMSQHNQYIDIILREIQIFTLRLEQIDNKKIHVPGDVSRCLWENIAHVVTHTLVQGFSEAKKCSNGGRALMQLDFTQFLTKFEKISRIQPMPHKEYVEVYVKAYYLPDVELEKWIKEHDEYSTKHLYGLISCACQNNKKTRQRLMQVIEDMEKGCQR